jgi:hypothetical protein
MEAARHLMSDPKNTPIASEYQTAAETKDFARENRAAYS